MEHACRRGRRQPKGHSHDGSSPRHRQPTPRRASVALRTQYGHGLLGVPRAALRLTLARRERRPRRPAASATSSPVASDGAELTPAGAGRRAPIRPASAIARSRSRRASAAPLRGAGRDRRRAGPAWSEPLAVEAGVDGDELEARGHRHPERRRRARCRCCAASSRSMPAPAVRAPAAERARPRRRVDQRRRALADALLTPGWTSYQERILIDTVDVTGLLREGDERRSWLAVGDGWYRGRFGLRAAHRHLRRPHRRRSPSSRSTATTSSRSSRPTSRGAAGSAPSARASIYDGTDDRPAPRRRRRARARLRRHAAGPPASVVDVDLARLRAADQPRPSGWSPSCR